MGHSCRETRPARSWRWSSVTGSSAWLSACWSWVSIPSWSSWRWGTRPFMLLCPSPWTKTKVGHAVLFMWREATHPSPYSGHHLGQEEWSGVLCVVYVEKATCPSPLSGHCSRQGKWSGVLCLLCALFMWREVAHGHCSGHAPCDL